MCALACSCVFWKSLFCCGLWYETGSYHMLYSVSGRRMANDNETERVWKENVFLIEVLFRKLAEGTGEINDTTLSEQPMFRSRFEPRTLECKTRGLRLRQPAQ
jgi:hypothetical protein